MESSGDNYISSEDGLSGQDQGRLTGDEPTTGTGSIGADKSHPQDTAEPFINTANSGVLTEQAQLARATSQGGLAQVPYDFEQKEGSWRFILSDSPFEVLYIDYRQRQTVAPPMVEKNYAVLQRFWQEKLMLMNGAAREKIKSRYGEETVSTAEKKLTDAYNKLKTAEGINQYTHQLEHRRIAAGIQALAPFIELTLADGELTPNEANILIARGIEKGLSEAETREHLLKTLAAQQFEKRTRPPQDDAFKNVWRQSWVKDPPQNTVGWLGAQVSSLEEMGQVSFANKEEAYDRFKNAVYLPAAVMTITRDDAKVKVFEKIIEQYSNEEIRYLKIVYRLNPGLPFRFMGGVYHSITGLLDSAVLNAAAFWKADEMFRNGYLQTWVEETDAASSLKLKGLQPATQGFLSFIYQVNPQYPFYLDQLRIQGPEDLAAALKQNDGLWPLATKYISSGYIAAWLNGIGRNDLNLQYNRLLEPVLQADWYNDQERNMAAVQTLIQTLADQMPVPAIMFNQAAVQLPAIAGTGHASTSFSVALQSTGYTVVMLYLRNAPPGVSVSAQKIILSSFNNLSKSAVTLDMDVFQLKKDMLYQFSVIARTPYQEIALPVQVKVAFPTGSFIQKLVMYGLGSGIFWALAHLIIRTLLGNPFASNTSRGIVFLLFSLAFLFVYYRVAAAAFSKELRGVQTKPISYGLLKTMLFFVYIFSPVIRESAGMWFFYWLFPGILLGAYMACKKYNLNKWLPLIPLIIIIVLALVLKGMDMADLLRRL